MTMHYSVREVLIANPNYKETTDKWGLTHRHGQYWIGSGQYYVQGIGENSVCRETERCLSHARATEIAANPSSYQGMWRSYIGIGD